MKESGFKGAGSALLVPWILIPDHAPHGYITTTPKPGWQNVDRVGKLKKALNLPLAIDTDVNAPTLGEYMWGNGQVMGPFVYYTIGTGIGLGYRMNNFLTHGLTHPEGGHILMHCDVKMDPFEGCCPSHKDCFEGLASGPSIEPR